MGETVMRVVINSNFNFNYRDADNTHMIDEDGIDWRNSGIYGDPASISDFEWDNGVFMEFSIYNYGFEEGAFMTKLTHTTNEMHSWIRELIDMEQLFSDYSIPRIENDYQQPDWGFIFGYHSQGLLIESLGKQKWSLDLCINPDKNWTELFFKKKKNSN